MLAEVKLPWAFLDEGSMLSGAEVMEMDRRGRYGLFSETRERASVVVNVGCKSGEIFSLGDGRVSSEMAMPIIDLTSVVSGTSWVKSGCSLSKPNWKPSGRDGCRSSGWMWLWGMVAAVMGLDLDLDLDTEIDLSMGAPTETSPPSKPLSSAALAL
jgi:hypothetical protein